MSKPRGTGFYQSLGFPEDQAARYADILNRLEKIDRGERAEPLTEDEKKFARYITSKIKSMLGI